MEEETMQNHDSAGTDRPETAATSPPEEGPAPSGENTSLSQSDCFQVSRVSLVYRYLLLLALTMVGGLLLSLLFPMAVADRDYLIGGLLVIWALALLRYWIFLLSMPYRICMEGTDSMVLRSLFNARKLECSEIASLRVSPFYQSYLRLVTSGKRSIPMLNHIDNLHDLILRIKRANPDLKTRGC
jgi:hypothetical protein